jgi:hypothetical protein
MIHPGLAALEKWDTIEYAAGYRARLAAIPDSEIAHHCWRCVWPHLFLCFRLSICGGRGFSN